MDILHVGITTPLVTTSLVPKAAGSAPNAEPAYPANSLLRVCSSLVCSHMEPWQPQPALGATVASRLIEEGLRTLIPRVPW